MFAALGRTVALALTKQASTALVRRMSKGLLSAPTIQRAATAMPAGKFRFVRSLGRGQFNLADRVVGNVGGTAGEMVRKLPTRQVGDVASHYTPLKSFVDNANMRYRGQAGGNPIAPYTHVNPRGAFQQLATEKVNLPPDLKAQLGDLHKGNLGPGGQILDFDTDALAAASNRQQFAQPLVDQVGQYGSRGYFRDHFGEQDLAPALQRQSDNLIRRHWSHPQQPAVPVTASRTDSLRQDLDRLQADAQRKLQHEKIYGRTYTMPENKTAPYVTPSPQAAPESLSWRFPPSGLDSLGRLQYMAQTGRHPDPQGLAEVIRQKLLQRASQAVETVKPKSTQLPWWLPLTVGTGAVGAGAAGAGGLYSWYHPPGQR